MVEKDEKDVTPEAGEKTAAPKKAAAKPKTTETKAPASKTAQAKEVAEKKAAAEDTAKDSDKAADAPKKAPAAKKSSDAKDATKDKSTETSAAKKPAAKSSSAAQKATDELDGKTRPSVIKAHHLRPVPGARTAKTRVGRGDGSKGKTAGRGTKGTKARYQVPLGFEGGQMPLHMRTPKLRGFKNPFRTEYQVVNLATLAALYPKGGAVTVTDLVTKGAVRKNEKVKVLGTGEIDVKLTVTVDKVSGSASRKIEAAGGSIVLPEAD